MAYDRATGVPNMGLIQRSCNILKNFGKVENLFKKSDENAEIEQYDKSGTK